MEITKDIKYLGVNDHEIDLFQSEYVVPNNLNYLMVIGALQEMFKEAKFKYSDKYININIDDSSIDIFFNEDSTKFIT